MIEFDHYFQQITNDEYHNVETLIIESYDHVIDIKGHQRKKEAKMLPARELAYLSNLLEMVEMLDAYDNTTVCRCIHLVLSQIWDILSFVMLSYPYYGIHRWGKLEKS